MSECQSTEKANELYNSLADTNANQLPEVDFNDPAYAIPDIDFSTLNLSLNTSILTSGKPNGTGVFDIIASSIKAHLLEEYKTNRVTGAEYTSAYIRLMESALTNATNFVLQRSQIEANAQMAKVEIIAAKIKAVSAKVELARLMFSAKTEMANLALVKLKLVEGNIQNCIQKYNLENILPSTLEGNNLDNQTKQFNLDETLPKQALVLESQIAASNSSTLNALEQNKLIKEQIEAQRAATLDTRTDGTPVAGSIGTEKALHLQQINTFARSTELNAAKMFAEAWTVTKTVDDGTLPPYSFSNESLESILLKIIQSHGLQVQ